VTGCLRLRGIARLAATLVPLAAGEAVLAHAGGALPPLSLDGERMARTFDEADPLAVAVSALRLVALGGGGALLAITAVGVAARAIGTARLVTQLNRCTPPSLRRLLDGALGAGLAAGIGFSVLPAGAAPTPSQAAAVSRTFSGAVAAIPRLDSPPGDPAPLPAGSHPTLRRLSDAHSPPPGADAPPSTLLRLSDASAPGGGRQADAEAPAPPPSPSATSGVAPLTPPSQTEARREVVVRPGDSFWRLAERHEAQRLGRRPSESEVASCWKELIKLNRHRLVVPDNPDLIFPGQVLHMPCP